MVLLNSAVVAAAVLRETQHERSSHWETSVRGGSCSLVASAGGQLPPGSHITSSSQTACAYLAG